MEERDLFDKQLNELWDNIKKTRQEIEEVETQISNTYQHTSDTYTKVEDQEYRKDILILKKQLESLKEEVKIRSENYEINMKKYIDQQSLILTSDWMVKQREKLIKRRLKEGISIKNDKERCEKLINDCFKIAQEFCKIAKSEGEEIKSSKSANEKKKKKKKKKKAEILIKALGLDALSEHFKYFSLTPPKDQKDLEESISLLKTKLSEINNRKLTEIIGIEYGDFGSLSSTNSAWSYDK